MDIKILPGTPETFAEIKGQELKLKKGEGFVYIKLVMVRPSTIMDGDPAQLVEDSPGILLCGPMNKICTQISKWFKESQKDYK